MGTVKHANLILYILKASGQLLAILLLAGWLPAQAQPAGRGASFSESYISELELQLDSGNWRWSLNRVALQQDEYLAFKYDERNEVARLRLYLRPGVQADSVVLLAGQEFDLTDSLLLIANRYYECQVQFKDLDRTAFPSFTFKIFTPDGLRTERIPLFPYTGTRLDFRPGSDDLYIGEEKSFELLTDNPGNIRTSNLWQSSGHIDYRILSREGKVFLHLLPRQLGEHSISVKARLERPVPAANGQLVYELPPITHTFTVKESRLSFLGMLPQEVIFDENASNRGIEVEIAAHPRLKMQKTYRIEAREQAGGALVAELFTRNQLSNDRVLCWLRVYQYHNPSEGYLYIKDGDDAAFVSNFSISPKTAIEQVSIMRDGGEWTQNLNIYPGEIIDVKVEGTGLNKANLKFEGLFAIFSDSAINNDQLKIFTLKIPVTIYKKKSPLYNHGKPTSFELSVREFRDPHPLNFVLIDYGEGEKPVTELNTTVLHYGNVPDILFTFNTDIIDNITRVYGKQHLTIDIKITGPRRELIDMRTIANLEICPSERSPRSRYYDKSRCHKGLLSINSYLGSRTSELPDWSRIEITIKHAEDTYGRDGFQQKLEIYKASRSSFDIDVSFPAGLLTQNIGKESSLGSFSGISLAAVAQFTFYRPGRIAVTKPYRIGVGVLAINAFNYRADEDARDVGLVVIGSVYPINRPGRKLSFPLHAGFGYRLNEGSLFFLIGPGIRVNF